MFCPVVMTFFNRALEDLSKVGNRIIFTLCVHSSLSVSCVWGAQALCVQVLVQMTGVSDPRFVINRWAAVAACSREEEAAVAAEEDAAAGEEGAEAGPWAEDARTLAGPAAWEVQEGRGAAEKGRCSSRCPPTSAAW